MLTILMLLRSSKIYRERTKYSRTLKRDSCMISMERKVSNKEAAPVA
jgi:hypothetical protein